MSPRRNPTDVHVLSTVLGPAVCQECRSFVWLTTDGVWRDKDGSRHRCALVKAA